MSDIDIKQQVDNIVSSDTDDYLVGYVSEDEDIHYKINDKYYEETIKKEKLIDFEFNNSGRGCIIIHHFILYKSTNGNTINTNGNTINTNGNTDNDTIFLLYINKNSERYTNYSKYDIYKVKYSNFEKQEIQYSTKNEELYEYDLILESMRKCYLRIRMVDKNCDNIFEYNKELKNLIGMEFLYNLTGIGHNTMCCDTCHMIAKDDKFTNHFVDKGYICGGGYWVSSWRCKNSLKSLQ